MQDNSAISLKKETLAQMLSCEFCEIFKNTLFHRTLPVVASARSISIAFNHINPFHAIDFFLYQLKSVEHLWFYDAFWRYRKRAVTWNGCKQPPEYLAETEDPTFLDLTTKTFLSLCVLLLKNLLKLFENLEYFFLVYSPYACKFSKL